MLLAMRASAPVDRPRSHAVYYTALSLGYALGSAAGGLLSQVDFSLLFWANGSVNILAAAAALWLLRQSPPVAADDPVDEAAGGARTSVVAQGLSPFIALCVAALLHYCVSNQRLAAYPLYLASHYGLSAAEIGMIFSVNGLVVAATGISLNGLLKSFDRRKVASAGSLALCASFALLPLGNQFAVALLLCIVMSLGDILFSPSAVSLAYLLAPHSKEGRRLGIFFAIAYSSRSLGPAAGVWASAALGASTFWFLCAVIGVAGMTLLCGLVRSR
jgi:predicted MFS family arabinose efflux permease